MLSVRKRKHELTFNEVKELIQLHTTNQNRMTRLLEEYKGHKLEIESMPRKEENKADNRIAHSFPYIISSTITGFMNTKPLIRCAEQELIDDVFKYNDSDKRKDLFNPTKFENEEYYENLEKWKLYYTFREFDADKIAMTSQQNKLAIALTVLFFFSVIAYLIKGV